MFKLIQSTSNRSWNLFMNFEVHNKTDYKRISQNDERDYPVPPDP